jgi:hypothetical protein
LEENEIYYKKPFCLEKRAGVVLSLFFRKGKFFTSLSFWKESESATPWKRGFYREGGKLIAMKAIIVIQKFSFYPFGFHRINT